MIDVGYSNPIGGKIEQDSIAAFQEQFISFRNRFKDYMNTNSETQLSYFKVRLASLKWTFSILSELIKEEYRKTAKNFNVFQIIGFGHYEVLTHTPFLAELLDANGSHGQGNLFQRMFLKNVLKPDDKAHATTHGWMVIKESESIDLRLVNHRVGLAVFIENKVYSGTHSGQLSKYYKLWKYDFKCRGRFIYLTPNGDRPGEGGFNEEVYPKNEVLSHLKLLSYKNDISEWLTSSLTLVEAPRVRETLLQYIDLISIL